MKVYLITGASSGFGKALAAAALARGDAIAVCARRAEPLEALIAASPDRGLALPLDVTDPAACAASVAATLDRFGRIDVLANIAGRGSLGAAEEFSEAELQQQMQLNFLAAVRMSCLALPSMRARRRGHILNLTSVGGLVSRGGFSAYAASKFALEGWTEAIRDELLPFGIRVTLVEPGAFRTEFSGLALMRPAQRIADYQPMIQRLADYMDASDGTQPGDPAKAAAAMIEVAESDNPPLRLMLGSDAYGLWDQKAAELHKDLAQGRPRGEATALDGVEVKPLGV